MGDFVVCEQSLGELKSSLTTASGSAQPYTHQATGCVGGKLTKSCMESIDTGMVEAQKKLALGIEACVKLIDAAGVETTNLDDVLGRSAGSEK
ncbi:hypothetical protein EJ419_03555 [Alloscardovia theropitheci]|uniref:Uncharacterized protein n=1 Tax=Alloscardovia theropitheci TaxID=2496842 RepID=A0A4R0QRY2_9BIFI|nr:hypothetical protein [Alloscardovia theropitheci]TCD54138.1 hypothetical protein EJ419_03555 [Alloscardovia theropitheci]